MPTPELLRAAVADFLKISPAELSAELPLAGKRFQDSIGRAALDAALRRKLGLHSPAVYSASTYGELENALLGGETPLAPSSSLSRSPAPPEQVIGPNARDTAGDGLACGVDLEEIDNLPTTDDYWNEAFYQTMFSPTEIAYCILQDNPRMHFAVRWCAKEALKKCDAAFLPQAMDSLELVNDDSGKPFLRQRAEQRRLPFAVSVSHTSTTALAIVLKSAPRTPVSANRATPAREETFSPSPTRSLATRMSLLLSFAATLLAIWAIVRTF
jgi:holo-[acyl-carrier protein] synthase